MTKKKSSEGTKEERLSDAKHWDKVDSNIQSPTWQKDAAVIEYLLKIELKPLSDILTQITKTWKDAEVENTFNAIPSVSYYMKTFRCKITIESSVGTVNTIFFHKQRAISESLVDYKDDLKAEMKYFVHSVIAEFATKGINMLREEVIKDQRERMFPEGNVPNAQVMLYPLVPNEQVIKENGL